MDSSSVAKVSAATVVVTGLGVGALAVVQNSQRLEQQGKIVIAAGNSQYLELAERYRAALKNYGVDVQARRTMLYKNWKGVTSLRTLEGRITMRALTDDSSGISAAFVKGNLLASMKGSLAPDWAKKRHAEFSKLLSVGRLFHEPIWVYTRGDLPIETLRDLKGKRILIGSRESGARGISRQLLKANGIDRDTATLLNEDLPTDAAPLLDGSADAAIVVLAAHTEKAQKLLRVPNIRLMNFAPEVEAYTSRFPAITRVVLHTGAVDFDPLVPSADITLLATSVALVVRTDMDPALISLLSYAVLNNPPSGFDKQGDPVLFHRASEFPSANDPEFTVPNEARVVYKSGELPFVLRQLAPLDSRFGIPFAYTSFISAHAAKLILLIPLLAVLVPASRSLPAIYVWLVRRRIGYWYRQLKALEHDLDDGVTPYDHGALQAEFERIDAHVRRLRVPRFFANQLYDLRGHIELVRHRLATRLARGGGAASGPRSLASTGT
jgi:hypothetical protein